MNVAKLWIFHIRLNAGKRPPKNLGYYHPAGQDEWQCSYPLLPETLPPASSNASPLAGTHLLDVKSTSHSFKVSNTLSRRMGMGCQYHHLKITDTAVSSSDPVRTGLFYLAKSLQPKLMGITCPPKCQHSHYVLARHNCVLAVSYETCAPSRPEMNRLQHIPSERCN